MTLGADRPLRLLYKVCKESQTIVIGPNLETLYRIFSITLYCIKFPEQFSVPLFYKDIKVIVHLYFVRLVFDM